MNNMKKILIVILALLMLMPNFAMAQNVDELNEQIEDKKSEIEQIKKQIAIYQNNIRAKQKEAASLENQMAILENQIAKTELDIKATDQEISQVQLETRELELKIIKAEDQINSHKNNLSETLRAIQKSDNENPLKIFVLNDSISDFFNQGEYLKDLQISLQDSLSTIKSEKKELDSKKDELQDKEEQLQDLQNQLELKKVELDSEIGYKDDLLVDTKNSEAKFQELYQQAKREQENINALIYNLEQEARKKLEQQKQSKPSLTDASLSWPVPKNYITAYFHDPEYPFRYLFEHPGIDIRAAQGTTLRAAAEGYVLKAKDAGMGYSYIAIIHADGLSTVYGHVSRIDVQADEYVAKGEVIGATGGIPGTPGAGQLCTGPHLHFEVRLNGIPVNPLDYLP